MLERKSLVLHFDPQTVDHLGARMYSNLPNALAELIANAFDADASKVEIVVGGDGTIGVVDDGHGMSRDQVANDYLHIGRNRRIALNSRYTESGKRKVSGKKGLGKLALFGIGKTVQLGTTRKGDNLVTVVTLSYDAMMAADGVYEPYESTTDGRASAQGTRVLLSDLKRTTQIDAPGLARSLSRLFNYADSSFAVSVIDVAGVSHPVSPELRLEAVKPEFDWRFPADFDAIDDQFLVEREVTGHIISTEKPLPSGMRGVTIYVNGRLANEPEFFGSSESSYAYSYLTGYLNVDFIDGLDPDVIATDRRAIDWGSDATTELRHALGSLLMRIGREWRDRRSDKRKRDRDKALPTPMAEWIDSIKSDESDDVRGLANAIISEDLDITAEQQNEMLRRLQDVAPPNAEFVWRHLHPQVQDAGRAQYEAGDYFGAVQESLKRYVKVLKASPGVTAQSEMDVLNSALGKGGKLRVFGRYLAGAQFTANTADNVEEGQKQMSLGLHVGFRNPLAHEEIAELHKAGAFSYQDCLEALGLLSHLWRRLDGATPMPVPKPGPLKKN
ncbi:TIGR02391 family protein [Rhodoglobus sp.]